MKQYCPSCLKGHVSGPPEFKPRLTTRVKTAAIWRFKYKCFECGSAYRDRSELLTKEEASDELEDMIRKLEALTLFLRG